MPPSGPQGRFVWHDLMTTSAERAQQFYAALFPEWSFQPAPSTEEAKYIRIALQGAPIGAIIQPAAPPAVCGWMGHVSIDSCDDAVQRARSHAGQCLLPPVTLPGDTRLTLLTDPAGARITAVESLRRSESHAGPGQQSGAFAWDELLTTDPEAARSFYQSVFGWSAVDFPLGKAGSYTLFQTSGVDVAGLLAMHPDATSRSHWLPYVAVADADQRAARADELGAETFVPPREVPGFGLFSVHADPDGASFALLQPENR
jgi:hypothetical protein